MLFTSGVEQFRPVRLDFSPAFSKWVQYGSSFGKETPTDGPHRSNNFISSEITSEYWLHRIYPPEIRTAHKNGDFHVHGLSLLSVYCVGWDLKDLLRQGFRGVEGKVVSHHSDPCWIPDPIHQYYPGPEYLPCPENPWRCCCRRGTARDLWRISARDGYGQQGLCLSNT